MEPVRAHYCALRYFRNAKLACSHECFIEQCRKFSSKSYTALTRRQLKQYCDVLGVSVTASEPKIKQAFYRKSLQLHPDRNKSVNSQHAFTEISEAYQAVITYKRSGNEDSKSQQTWKRTTEMNGFRPWAKVPEKKGPPPPPFGAGGVELDKHVIRHHTADEASLKVESNAGDFCNEFYIEQMERDFERYHMEKLKKQKELNEESTSTGACVIM
uniref:DnaJ homolog subfamily C member 30-like n=1 Tax=Phallusia mammillata TaxID=59560 RepID=A0A6F9DBS3_9ASCI|nr:dnaJ homolog subfamily C member 30-like [Phallusia mammillata]